MEESKGGEENLSATVFGDAAFLPRVQPLVDRLCALTVTRVACVGRPPATKADVVNTQQLLRAGPPTPFDWGMMARHDAAAAAALTALAADASPHHGCETVARSLALFALRTGRPAFAVDMPRPFRGDEMALPAPAAIVLPQLFFGPASLAPPLWCGAARRMQRQLNNVMLQGSTSRAVVFAVDGDFGVVPWMGGPVVYMNCLQLPLDAVDAALLAHMQRDHPASVVTPELHVGFQRQQGAWCGMHSCNNLLADLDGGARSRVAFPFNTVRMRTMDDEEVAASRTYQPLSPSGYSSPELLFRALRSKGYDTVALFPAVPRDSAAGTAQPPAEISTDVLARWVRSGAGRGILVSQHVVASAAEAAKGPASSAGHWIVFLPVMEKDATGALQFRWMMVDSFAVKSRPALRPVTDHDGERYSSRRLLQYLRDNRFNAFFVMEAEPLQAPLVSSALAVHAGVLEASARGAVAGARVSRDWGVSWAEMTEAKAEEEAAGKAEEEGGVQLVSETGEAGRRFQMDLHTWIGGGHEDGEEHALIVVAMLRRADDTLVMVPRSTEPLVVRFDAAQGRFVDSGKPTLLAGIRVFEDGLLEDVMRADTAHNIHVPSLKLS